MGFNVADQFRKWRRNSNQREFPSVDNQQQYENSPMEASVAATVAVDPSLADKNIPKKLRKPPAKQYPPSPDTYLNGIGDYTFVRQVGQGKFSRVMLSYHCLTRKQVAVKVLLFFKKKAGEKKGVHVVIKCFFFR